MQDAHAPNSSRPRSPRRVARIAWLVLVLGAGVLLGVGVASRYAQEPQKGMVVLTADQAAAQRLALRQREADIQRLRTDLDTAGGELAIERAARIELEAQLKIAQEEAGRARDQLAFFEQLLPAGPEGAVDIRGAQLERSGQALAYKVLLMRSGRASDTPFAGALRFHAVGRQNEQKAEFDLAPLRVKEDRPAGTGSQAREAASDSAPGQQPSDKPAGNALPVQFDQYLRSQGMLELPESFVPETVTVSVLEGDAVRASRVVPLILSPASPGL